MLKRFFFLQRIRVKYFHKGRQVRSSKLFSDILLKSRYDLRYPEYLSKYLAMEYAQIRGELHIHEDFVKGFDSSGNELSFQSI